jgi:hypothetical protein
MFQVGENTVLALSRQHYLVNIKSVKELRSFFNTRNPEVSKMTMPSTDVSRALEGASYKSSWNSSIKGFLD